MYESSPAVNCRGGVTNLGQARTEVEPVRIGSASGKAVLETSKVQKGGEMMLDAEQSSVFRAQKQMRL